MGGSFRRSVSAVVVVGLLLALSGCGRTPATTKGSSNDTIQVGAVLSLSGSYAGLGQPEKNVIDLEVARINAEGGINGKKLEVVTEDDATDASKAQTAASKLIDKGVVAILGATGTGQTMALRPDAERAGVPVVSMAGGSIITEQFSPLVFQTPWPNRLVVPFTLKYLQSTGAKRLALISVTDGYGKDGREVVLKNLKAYGVELVADEKFNPGDTDMTSQLTKIKAAKPDAVWLWSAGKEAATVMKNAASVNPALGGGLSGSAFNMVGAPGNARVEFIQGADGSADLFRFAAGKILLPEAYGKDSEAYKVATDFIARYRAKYGKNPDIFAGHAYDALHIVVEAAKRVDGEVTPEKMRAEIEKTDNFVGIGGTFTYSASDHNGLTENDLVMYRIRNGKWELAK